MPKEPKKYAPLEDWQRALVESHTGLVIYVATRKLHVRAPVPDDLMQAGKHALCVAASKYDPSRGIAYNTYAAHWVRAYMVEHMIRNHGPATFGKRRSERKVYFQLGKVRDALARELGPEAADDSALIAERMGVDVEDVDAMRSRLGRTQDVHFDMEYPGGKFEVPDPSTLPEATEDAVERAERLERVRAALGQLKPNERRVIRGRYFRNKTLQSIGDEMKVTRQRAQQIEVTAMAKLRAALL